MTIQRMDNVLIVVDDLEAAKAFFAAHWADWLYSLGYHNIS
jgi:hypothetical protein